ncbi:MAG: FG-GAP repeat domain-containing protein [Paracoccaceae bacterium]
MKSAAGVALLALALARTAAACDYPGPPPGSGEATAEGSGILWAGFSDATTRYDHGILGDRIEAGGLRVRTAGKGPCELFALLGAESVFEDLAPRIGDLNDDGRNDVVAVETDIRTGASLAVYSVVGGRLRKIAATPNIGRSHRWLAPVGIADFNADGYTDVAYVETPHIGGTLRIWSMRGGRRLREIARVAGLANHLIGDDFISGGVRRCDGKRPVIVVADQRWTRVIGVVFHEGRPVVSELGPNRGQGSFRKALTCG